MADVFTKKKRSEIMSKIRSEWTLQEYKVHDFLGEEKIKHKMHPKIYGRPDIILNKNLIVFLDGCFWHGCAKHCRLPETRKEYWENKIRKKETFTSQRNSKKIII